MHENNYWKSSLEAWAGYESTSAPLRLQAQFEPAKDFFQTRPHSALEETSWLRPYHELSFPLVINEITKRDHYALFSRISTRAGFIRLCASWQVEKLQQSQRSLDALLSLLQQRETPVTPHTEEGRYRSSR